MWAREELINPQIFPAGSTHSTFNANPLGTAVALEAMRMMQEEDFGASVMEKGAHFLEGIKELKKKHAIVGDVDGLGLALRIEICEPHDSYTPSKKLVDLMADEAMKGDLVYGGERYGLVLDIGGYHKNVITLAPASPSPMRRSTWRWRCSTSSSPASRPVTAMRARILDLDGAIMLQPEMMDACARSGGIRTAASDLAPACACRRTGARSPISIRASAPTGPGTSISSARVISIIWRCCWWSAPGARSASSISTITRTGPPGRRASIAAPGSPARWSSRTCCAWSRSARTVRPRGAADQGRRPAISARGRLELHPFASSRTFYAGRGFAVPGATAAPGVNGDGLAWHGLEDGDWHMRISEIAARLPDAPVWISLDKDVLTETEALTNWDQGACRSPRRWKPSASSPATGR